MIVCRWEVQIKELIEGPKSDRLSRKQELSMDWYLKIIQEDRYVG